MIAELCLIPEVYFALSELLASTSKQPSIVGKCNIIDEENNNVNECQNHGVREKDSIGVSEVDNPLELASDVVDYFERTSKIRNEKLAERKCRF